MTGLTAQGLAPLGLLQIAFPETNPQRIDGAWRAQDLLVALARLSELVADGVEYHLVRDDVEARLGPTEVPVPIAVVQPATLIERSYVRRVLPRAVAQIVRHQDFEDATGPEHSQQVGHGDRQIGNVLEDVVGNCGVETVLFECDRPEALGLELRAEQ